MPERTKRATKPQAAPAQQYSAPALEKGLDILEVLCRSDRGLSTKELSAKLGRSVGEIYRMLTCLINRNYVANNGETYALTTRLFELSHIHPPTERLLQECVPVMLELADRLDQSCHVTVYNRGKQVVLAKVDAPTGMGFSMRVGAEIGVTQSASGRVLLAFQDPDTMRMRLEESMEGTSRKEVLEMGNLLREVARNGFASFESNQFRGLHAVSFPILNSQQQALASLTVPYLERLDRDDRKSLIEVERVLGEAARKLTRRMGGR